MDFPEKRSPGNKTTCDSNQLLFITLASQLLSIFWVPCYVFWSLVWFVANRWSNRLLWRTTKTAASGKTIRKSVADPVNNVACLSIICCWLDLVGSKVPSFLLTWALLPSVRLPEVLSYLPSTWQLGMSTWPPCFPLCLVQVNVCCLCPALSSWL